MCKLGCKEVNGPQFYVKHICPILFYYYHHHHLLYAGYLYLYS